MENIKDLEPMLRNAIRECCKNADCHTLEKIFKAAEWTWCDHVTDEDYCPKEREIRYKLYSLGEHALDCLMKKYNSKCWDKECPKPCTMESGRLYFTIDLNTETGEEVDVMHDIRFACGIQSEEASSTFGDVSQDDYIVETYCDNEECIREKFGRNNQYND